MIKLMKSTALIIIGAIVGPLLVAAIGAWISASQEKGPWDASNEASRLVEAYRARLRPGRLFLSVPAPPDGDECGYDPDKIFPDGFDQMVAGYREHKFTAYGGYWYLHGWRDETRDREWIAAITQSIDGNLSEFEAGFLRRCIEATIFSSSCMARVEAYGDSVKRFGHNRQAFPAMGFGIENEIVCTYVDGIAARQGVPLSTRKTD